jgi:hypothetical protein
LEYTCDSVLLEFYPVKEVDAKIYKLPNKNQAKERISKESYRLGVGAFNILGGLDIEKTASPMTLKRKKNYSTMAGFNTENPELLDFENRFNNNFSKASEKYKDNYKFYETSEIFITNKKGKYYVIIIDKKDNEIHKRIYNKFANLISYVIDIPMENGN